MYVDSHTRCGKSSRVSAVIPLGHANPLGLVLAHTGVRRILREPTTLVKSWDLILDFRLLKIAHNFHFKTSLTSTLPLYS